MKSLKIAIYASVLAPLWLGPVNANTGPGVFLVTSSAADSGRIGIAPTFDQAFDADALPATGAQQTGDRRSAQHLALKPSPTAKITEQQATQAALRAVPGEVTDVAIETKKGKKVYVIEIVEKNGGKETDVFVDMVTGEVVGTD